MKAYRLGTAMLGVLVSAAIGAASAQADAIHDDVAADMPELMALYRDLHANPE